MTRYLQTLTLAIAGVGFGLLIALVPAADASEVYGTGKANVAIEGADPVAYFTQSTLVEGSETFSTTWKDAEWRFSSEENLALFEADPEAYAPQYGGYCAWAVSRGYTAEIDPEAWRIVDGKLYLNYSKDVQKDWEEDVPGNIQKGDANWPGLRADLIK